MGLTEKIALGLLCAFVVLGVIQLFSAPLKLALKVLFNTLLGFAAPRAAYEGGNHDVLQRGELGQELVELEDEADMLVAKLRQLLLAECVHIQAVEDNCPLVGLVQRAHNLEQGGLSRSAGPYDRDYLAFFYVQVDAAQDL